MEQALQKTWQGRQGKGVAHCVNVQLGFTELFCGMNVQLVESLWVRNREEAGKADTVMGCCYSSCGYSLWTEISLNLRVFVVTHPGSHGGLDPRSAGGLAVEHNESVVSELVIVG